MTGTPVELAEPVNTLDHLLGDRHARVAVIEYGDLECPICLSVEPAVQHLIDVYGARIAFVFRHFPIEDAHPHALLAAEAAECAGAQGRFWEMRARLLHDQHHLNLQHIEAHARELELDLPRFGAELRDETYRQRVREHQDSGRRSHVRASPAFFVNGRVCDVSMSIGDLFSAVAHAFLRR
jgi:protein-disulfide isomerase